MRIEEELIEIIVDKGEVTHRGRLSSGDDINKHWYECFDIKIYNNDNFIDLCQEIIKHFSKRRLEYSIIGLSFSIQIENSVLLQRKEKLENLKNNEEI